MNPWASTVRSQTTRDFGAGCKREYVRVLRLIGKVNEPEYKGRYREGRTNRLEIGE